jgi:hypothetical protein
VNISYRAARGSIVTDVSCALVDRADGAVNSPSLVRGPEL